MSRTDPRLLALPLLLAALAGSAGAQAPAAAPADPACLTGVAQDFNRVVPLLSAAQREAREGDADLSPFVGRLNDLRGRITGAMDAGSPTRELCEALARELAQEREALLRAAPAALPVIVPEPVASAPPPPTPVLAASPRPAAPAARVPERRAAAPAPATPVKRATYVTPPAPPAPRVDPQLEACKVQLRQTHADAQLQLQRAARGGRIAPQKLPDMQQAQGRLAGLSGQVRRDFGSLGECQQVGQVLVQEVDNIQALAR